MSTIPERSTRKTHTAATSTIPVHDPHSVQLPVPPDALLKLLDNDYGNACRLVALYGDSLRYCHSFKKWLVWDGTRWLIDRSGSARRYAENAMLDFYRESRDSGDDIKREFAKSSLNDGSINHMLHMAESSLHISVEDLDTSRDLLNFTNGTLDLSTGILTPHSRSHLITKLIHHPYSIDAECPRFLSFIESVTSTRPGLAFYLQRAFGYSLTGHTSEKAVFLLWGDGNNGKSTLLTTFLTLLSEYGTLLQIDTLMAQRQESNNSQSDLVDLRGARFAMTSETEKGQRLAEGKLKRITQGMGRIRAARKYENQVEFPETHKLWIDANHLPVVRGTDNAIWNRLHPVPFDIVVPRDKQDRALPETLLAESAGILAWAVEGSLVWSEMGLGRPPDVSLTSEAWRSKSDQMSAFLEMRCNLGEDCHVMSADLYNAYRLWADSEGEEYPYTKRELFGRVKGLPGVGYKHVTDGNRYLGIGLRRFNGRVGVGATTDPTTNI